MRIIAEKASFNKNNGVFGDEIFLHSTANILSSNIYIFSAIKSSSTDQVNGYSKIVPKQPAMNEDLYLFLFNESDFKTPHYESIFKKEGFEMPPPETVTEGFDLINNEPVDMENRVGRGSRGKGSRGRGNRGRPKGSRNKKTTKDAAAVDNANAIDLDNAEEDCDNR